MVVGMVIRVGLSGSGGRGVRVFWLGLLGGQETELKPSHSDNLATMGIKTRFYHG